MIPSGRVGRGVIGLGLGQYVCISTAAGIRYTLIKQMNTYEIYMYVNCINIHDTKLCYRSIHAQTTPLSSTYRSTALLNPYVLHYL